MIFEIGVYRLEVDVESTQAYYATHSGIGCDCAGCRNYEKAVPMLAPPVQSFLLQFGIDPGSPIEMSAVHSPDGCRIFYDGFFHICGRILEGNDPWIQTGPKNYMLNQDYLIGLDEDGSAYILERCALVDTAFPRPVIQLHISFSLPWLLDEPNPYRD